MNVKSSTIDTFPLLLTSLFLCLHFSIKAENFLPTSIYTTVDTTLPLKEKSANRYEQKIHRYRERWESLIPTHAKIQFAGNMGLLSMGTGWNYGKHQKWETDILLGFIPKHEAKRGKITFTLKQTYIPWSLKLKKNLWSIEPLTCGSYLNTVFGDEFWVHEPERYPKGYYGFSSKVRIHIFLGESFTWNIPHRLRFREESVSIYYEISTNDFYLISALTNHYMKPKDYLSLSFGIKLQFF